MRLRLSKLLIMAVALSALAWPAAATASTGATAAGSDRNIQGLATASGGQAAAGASPSDTGAAEPNAPDATAPGDDSQGAAPSEPDISSPNIDPNAPPPAVEYDLSKLPEPVRQMRDRILTAARTGAIDALRPLLGTGATMTDVGGDAGTDPIDFLKSLSGDPDGREILAILVDILNAGYVHLNAGTPNEIYAWPYFFAYPINKLTPPQMVELFEIMTAGDFEDMKSYGAYIFYRVGITPDGKWRFFVAGE